MTDKHSAGEQLSDTHKIAIAKALYVADRKQEQELSDLFELVANILTAATAEAKLAGELAGREAAVTVASWIRLEDSESTALSIMEHIKALKLTPKSASVLERIKRAEREQEADWWHRNWHRDTGIPCDGTMEVCRRALGQN